MNHSPIRNATGSRGSSSGAPRSRDAAARIAREVAQAVLPRDEIRRRQRRIHAEVLQLSRSMDTPNFTRLDSDDLRRLAMLYDREFFGSALLDAIGRDRLRFELSSRMTRVAGKLVTHHPPPAKGSGTVGFTRADARSDDARRFELVLSSTLLFQAFSDVDRPITVTGLECRDRLEAMQRVCEHELVHLLEMFLWKDSSCAGERFQSIAGRFFGHTDYRHDLITQSERAARKFDLRVGSLVRFRHDGQDWVGRVNRITRRATVLVEDARGEPFGDGRRYLRFYVPLENLRREGPSEC